MVWYDEKEKGGKKRMEQFHGEPVLAQAQARLVPPNGHFEDCICRLVLTQSYFYALEDNFDGSFEEKLVIPVSHIQTIEEVAYQKDGTKKAGGGGLEIASMVANVFFGALAGVMLLSGAKKNAPAKYLEITHVNENGRNTLLHFNECASVKPLIRAFNKRQMEKYKY